MLAEKNIFGNSSIIPAGYFHRHNLYAVSGMDRLSDGQLRFYFKDIEGANITSTPIGYYTDVEGLTEAVQEAYTSNLDDTWGVDVYFWIIKTLE